MKRFLLVILGLVFLASLCLADNEADRYTLKYIYRNSPLEYRNQLIFQFKLEFPKEVNIKPIMANLKFDYNSVEELAEEIDDHLSIMLRVKKMKLRYTVMNKKDSVTVDNPGDNATQIELLTTGKVIDVIGPNAADTTTGNQPLSPENYIKTVIAVTDFLYWILPAEPVGVGDEWVIPYRLPSFREGMPGLELPLTHRLAKVKTSGNRRLATIISRGKWDIQTEFYGSNFKYNSGGSQPGQPGFEEMSIHLPLEWIGETVFDITDGCLRTKKVELKGDGVIEVTESAQTVPFRMTVLVKINAKRVK